MSPTAPLAVLALLALLCPPATSDTTAPYAPLSVVALPTADPTALVAWVQGEVPADSYRVYGANANAVPVLLFDTAQEESPALAEVPAGFAQYGVAGVFQGTESAMVLSPIIPIPPPDGCISVAPPPEPEVSVCKLTATSLFKVRVPHPI